MADITITLTSTEEKCLQYAAASPADWIENLAQSRAMVAKKEIIATLVEHCNANDVQIATGEDAQVTQAFELKVVDTAANRNSAAESSE